MKALVVFFVLLCSATTQAAPTARIVVSSDPEYFPPHHHIFDMGDSGQVSLERLAIVYMEMKKDQYYFKIYKNGRYLAEVRPEDGQATILVGNYKFEVFDLKDHYMGEVFVQTQVWTQQESLIGDILIIVAIMLAICIFILIKRISGYRARKRYTY